jgi:hypothetical protein
MHYSNSILHAEQHLVFDVSINQVMFTNSNVEYEGLHDRSSAGPPQFEAASDSWSTPR